MGSGGEGGRVRQVLIDTDGGTDDAMAIWMMLKAHHCPKKEVRVLGVTCVAGNTDVHNVVVNVARILRAAGEHGNIPIFRGSSTPIVEPFKHQLEPFHGENGFGDVDHFLEPIQPIIADENGVMAMIRLINQFAGNISILALGPLTNLALAVRLDPSIKSKLLNIYVMGGNIEGEGNATMCAEFNFAIDPEAAFITLTNYSCPILIVPWEVCKREATTHEWRVNVLGKVNSPQVKLLNKAEEKILELHKESWIPCDQLAAAVLINPEVIQDMKHVNCTIELHGQHSRGLFVIDHMSLHKKPENVAIVLNFKSDLLKDMLLWAVSNE